MEETASNQICPIRYEVPGAKVTTYNIGGPLKFLFEPNSTQELQALVKSLSSENRSFKVLGGGSNLLIPSQGVDDPVIRLGNGFKYWENKGEGIIQVGASMPLIRLSQETAQAGLSGLEFAGGIPASFGGAVRMNAGAHGGDISQILDRVTILTYDGALEEVAANRLDYGYRRSNIGSLGIVVSATIKMKSGDKDKILELRAKNLAHRKSAQPITIPSAGSIFKNPSSDITAGIIIERAGLKGFKVGGAEISTMHGNWILNPDRLATSEDVKSCISEVQRVVQEKFGIALETELVAW